MKWNLRLVNPVNVVATDENGREVKVTLNRESDEFFIDGKFDRNKYFQAVQQKLKNGEYEEYTPERYVEIFEQKGELPAFNDKVSHDIPYSIIAVSIKHKNENHSEELYVGDLLDMDEEFPRYQLFEWSNKEKAELYAEELATRYNLELVNTLGK